MKVPILKLPFTPRDKRAILARIKGVFNSPALTQGPLTKEFEQKFAEMCQVKYCLAASSGTTALELILRALNVEEKSVVVPTNTFAATALAALHAGAKGVVFCDSDPATLSIDPDDLERKVRPDTAAVMLVHIGGIITPALDRIAKFCKSRNIALIEDAAHAHGCRINGRPAGSLGLAAGFSLFPTKPLTTGEGGMVTTNDEALYKKMVILRNQGKDPAQGNQITEVGNNWRMSEITAAIGLQQMASAASIFSQRREIAAYYDKALPGVRGITPLAMPEGNDSTYYKYVCYLDNGIERGALKKLMQEKYQVQLTGEVYSDLCHALPVWKRYPKLMLNSPGDKFPGGEKIAKEHICMPLSPGFKKGQIRYAAASLRKALRDLTGS